MSDHNSKTVHRRFWEKVDQGELDFIDKDGQNLGKCWEWSGGTNEHGYGCFQAKQGNTVKNGRIRVYSHIYAFQEVRGPIPQGLVLDHLCRNRRCVHPKHLEVVTRKENVLRGVSKNAQNARKTHCINGHHLSGENLYVRKDTGRRMCVACQRQYQKSSEYKRKMREKWARRNQRAS